jgi:anion-transporting  ArsA/GET3 family ATPase
VRALYRAVFENRLVQAFLRATPGLYQWAMLGKAWYHTTETMSDGSPRFDVVIVDAPSTGHGLDMLRGPKVIVDVAPPGLLRREAERAWSLFADPGRSGVILVTLPEEMPVTETLDLLQAMRSELKLPVVQVVVNGVLPPLFSARERDALLQPRDLDPSVMGDAALAAGARRARRELVQHEALVRLRDGVDLPLVYLPYVFDDVDSLKAITDLAARMR